MTWQKLIEKVASEIASGHRNGGRWQRAVALAKSGRWTRHAPGKYTFRGSRDATYTVEDGSCACADFHYRGQSVAWSCKHGMAAAILDAAFVERVRLARERDMALPAEHPRGKSVLFK